MLKQLLRLLLKLLFKPKFKRFTVQEFTKSDTAKALRIDNSIKCTDIGKALIYTISTAEKIRRILGVDIEITSGYRCRKLNIAVKGSKYSYHMRGEAFDFKCSLTPKQVCDILKKSDLVYDQMIMYPWGVHIGCPMKRKRMQFIDKTI